MLQKQENPTILINKTVIGLFAVTLLILVSQTPEMFHTAILNGMFVQNEFTFFVKVLIILGIIASLTLAPQYLAEAQIIRFEYPILVLFAGLGMMIMVSANDMLSALYGA